MVIPVVPDRLRTWVVVVGAVLPLVACAVMSLVRNSVPDATAVLLLVLIVVVAASTGLRTAGIVASLSAGVSFDYFLTQPYRTLVIDDPNDLEAATLLVVIGAAVCEVALWGQRQQASAQRRAGYLDGILATVQMVTASSGSPRALIDHVADQIRRVLDVRECVFVAGELHDARTAVLDHRGQVTRRGHTIDVDRVGLPTDDHTALVVRQGNVALGYFLLTSASDVARPALEQRTMAVLLADQVGSLLSQRPR